jgi:hypothetical protein
MGKPVTTVGEWFRQEVQIFCVLAILVLEEKKNEKV